MGYAVPAANPLPENIMVKAKTNALNFFMSQPLEITADFLTEYP
jgi:hypothetical protein